MDNKSIRLVVLKNWFVMVSFEDMILGCVKNNDILQKVLKFFLHDCFELFRFEDGPFCFQFHCFFRTVKEFAVNQGAESVAEIQDPSNGETAVETEQPQDSQQRSEFLEYAILDCLFVATLFSCTCNRTGAPLIRNLT